MSRNHAALELSISQDEAAAACRAALGDLGWMISAEKGAIVGDEDPVRLHCHQQPATARLYVEAERQGQSTRIAIEIRVPGLGPISSRHASERSRIVARAILARIDGL